MHGLGLSSFALPSVTIWVIWVSFFFFFFDGLCEVQSNLPFQAALITTLMPLNHCCDEISYFLITFSI